MLSQLDSDQEYDQEEGEDDLEEEEEEDDEAEVMMQNPKKVINGLDSPTSNHLNGQQMRSTKASSGFQIDPTVIGNSSKNPQNGNKLII